MRGIYLLAALAFLPLFTPGSFGAERFPYKLTVESNDAIVRSGPGEKFYATGFVDRGQEVQVYQRKSGGWLGIRPPAGSFSWVDAEKLKLTRNDEVGQVVATTAVAWVGSEVDPVDEHRWQVKLDADEAVQLLGQGTLSIFSGDAEREFYQIAPPAGEFRWIHEDDVREAGRVTGKSSSDSEIRLAEFLLADDESSEETTRDGFVARGSGESETEGTRQEPATSDTRPSAASRHPFLTELEAIELQLSLIAAKSPEEWKLNELLRQSQKLLDDSNSTIERGKARLLMAKVQEFESLKQRYAGLEELQASDGTSEPLAEETTLQSSDEKTFDPRFDGRGWLLPVVSKRYSAPPYALLNGEGEILTYVTPAPGINLNRFMRKQVGIFGQRSQAEFLGKKHLTADRVVELNRQQSRFKLSSLLPRLGAR